jgi:hypothetical protein
MKDQYSNVATSESHKSCENQYGNMRNGITPLLVRWGGHIPRSGVAKWIILASLMSLSITSSSPADFQNSLPFHTTSSSSSSSSCRFTTSTKFSEHLLLLLLLPPVLSSAQFGRAGGPSSSNSVETHPPPSRPWAPPSRPPGRHHQAWKWKVLRVAGKQWILGGMNSRMNQTQNHYYRWALRRGLQGNSINVIVSSARQLN